MGGNSLLGGIAFLVWRGSVLVVCGCFEQGRRLKWLVVGVMESTLGVSMAGSKKKSNAVPCLELSRLSSFPLAPDDGEPSYCPCPVAVGISLFYGIELMCLQQWLKC